MRVLNPGPSENSEWVVPLDSRDFESLTFDGTPRSKDWVPIRVERVVETEHGQQLVKSDFPWLGSGKLALRQRATELLAPALEPYAELLPLEWDVPIWAVNVLTVVDALDEDRSTLVRFDSGRIMRVERYAFRKEVVDDLLVFKVPQLARSAVFVSSAFVELVERSGLTGIEFRLLWESS